MMLTTWSSAGSPGQGSRDLLGAVDELVKGSLNVGIDQEAGRVYRVRLCGGGDELGFGIKASLQQREPGDDQDLGHGHGVDFPDGLFQDERRSCERLVGLAGREGQPREVGLDRRAFEQHLVPGGELESLIEVPPGSGMVAQHHGGVAAVAQQDDPLSPVVLRRCLGHARNPFVV